MNRANVFKGSPMLGIIVPLMLGIYMQHIWTLPIVVLLCVIGSSSGALIFLLYKNKFISAQHIVLFFFLLGIGGLRLKVQSALPLDDISNVYKPPLEWTAFIDEVYPKKNYAKLVARLTEIRDSSAYAKASGKIMLYDYSRETSLKKGDVIRSLRPLRRIRNRGNPGEFDAELFYRRRGIFYQSSFYSKEDYVNEGNRLSGPMGALMRLRSSIKNKLDASLPNKESRSIASALLLGKEDNDIDEELIRSYQAAGVVHIIVISGLHIGFLAFMISLLLSPLKKYQSAYITAIRLALTLGCIWTFSIIAGLGVSVLRAAIMFSFLEVNRLLYRKQNPFHTLALSALVILTIDPYELWNVGFIFSFSALTGIFLLADINKKTVWSFSKNYIVKYILGLMLASVAANIFVAPIAIYFFGKFYPYFVIANIAAVPLSGIILVAAVLSLSLSWAPALSFFLYKIFYLLIALLNTCVRTVASFPGAALDARLSLMETWLICGGLFFLVYCLLMRRKAYAYVSSVFIIVYIACGAYAEYAARRQEGFIFCNLNKESIPIVLVSGKQSVIYVKDSSLASHIYFNRIKDNIAKSLRQDSLRIVFIPPNVGMQIYSLDNRRIIAHVLKEELSLQDSAALASCDYIVNDTKEANPRLQKMFPRARIIHYQCANPSPNDYEIKERGAFVKLWKIPSSL